MAERNMTQGDVAAAAGVSQSTVSRVLQREPQRSGAGYLRLCSWMRQQTVPDGLAPAEIMTALRETWDGSDGHAAALAALIEASAKIWPGLADLEERSSTTQPGSAHS